MHEQNRLSVGVFTSGRQDWSILEPLAASVDAHLGMRLVLLVSGMHLSRPHGYTIQHIETSCLPIAERLETLHASDSAVAVGQAAGWTTSFLSAALQRHAIDILVLLGDRTETLAAGVAATCLRVPIAHIAGGEETEGAIDNVCRHALTKLSHIHFVSNELHASRVVQMGEDAARVYNVGAPGLDQIRRVELLGEEALGEELGIAISKPLIVMTHHPATLDTQSPASEVETVLAGVGMVLEDVPATLVITLPNADEGSVSVRSILQQFAKERPNVHTFEALGARRYLSLLSCADLVLGNSSSGLIETPAFELPTVNVGNRQGGRLRGRNVLDAAVDTEAIAEAIERGLTPEFRRSLRGMENPYGDGRSTERMMRVLEDVANSGVDLAKSFKTPSSEMGRSEERGE